ncbi:SNF2-related protein [Sphaerotilus sp.]|uniref:SNF2-related protein n=1 Tax=Sphaerotilus sp. TaxID=2093942 RepID=UPI00286D7515|nr:SNF2-related protein [Sphaerotilus sp.]
MFGLTSRKTKAVRENPAAWYRQLSASGLLVTRETQGTALDDPLLGGYLDQLRDDGCLIDSRIGYHLSWDKLMAALEQPGYEGLPQALALPPVTALRPALCSRDSLSDSGFLIALAGWVDETGRTRIAEMTGPIVSLGERAERMSPAQWQLVRAVIEFAQRPASQHTDQVHREAWGRIRQLALAADARLDDFLSRSVVLTPEKLDLQMRRSTVLKDENVIEIVPGFAQAPADWLDRFDRNPAVLDRYDLPTHEGIVQVLITPAVKTVLQEIKRFPARRVAGVRAQAFILNPFAALGAEAHAVINEQQFEQAREAAGLRYERFLPVIDRDASGYPVSVCLSIESTGVSHAASSELVPLSDETLAVFVDKLERALARGFLLLGWNGYDLELQGDAPAHLAELQDALAARTRPRLLIQYAQVHDLSAYSPRVEGIGIEKPYYSPYIAKKKEAEGWFPDNVQTIISFTPPGQTEPVAIAATKEVIQQIAQGIEAAEASGATTITLPGLPVPMPVSEAKNILEIFKSVGEDIKSGHPPKPPGPVVRPVADGKTLVIRPNIDTLDHDESRRQTLQTQPAAPELPTRFTHGTALLAHQYAGLAWLQHLHRLRSSHQVRGAVLADDMGLGKTLQLLSFMVSLNERQPHGDPMLVVAPVSLLENWRDELDKFFPPGTLPVLTAYGDALKTLRVPREAIDERLRTEDGLVRFLRPNWIGSARLVLTTYETLRDLEFSFAVQRWSVMVCDEAQRIKNPAAMVTRAAKKQNADFRIACTGTPVENTLADLWCLFDFIQPGLLGTLNAFGRRYRKPIEARTDDEKSRVDELRARIQPQILRRTKAEVAKDLPRKMTDPSCARLPLSMAQRHLYAQAINAFKARHVPGAVTPFRNHLSLLHYLRLICTDPCRPGMTAFKPEPIAAYRAKAPKLDWLLRQLDRIRMRQEKVIVFCEFRNIQRLLQHYIAEAFGLRADIINGDTSAAVGHEASRQKRIKAFQSQPGFGVIILSPVAVGFGVNIQAANHVVHYTRTWNPAKEDQATDRAYRIGQTKDVFVYYPVVQADDFCTFDVKLDRLLTNKRELAQDMLNGSGDIGPGDFGDLGDQVPPDQARGLDEPVTADWVLRMDGRYFEGLIAILWQKQGFGTCYCTPASGDNGVDVVAIGGVQGVLLQTKTNSREGGDWGGTP